MLLFLLIDRIISNLKNVHKLIKCRKLYSNLKKRFNKNNMSHLMK